MIRFKDEKRPVIAYVCAYRIETYGIRQTVMDVRMNVVYNVANIKFC